LNYEIQNISRPLNPANLSQQEIAKRLPSVQTVRKSGSISAVYPVLEQKSSKRPQPSAVLVPLLWRSGEWHLLLIRRSESVSSHKGQIAFPGGRWEESDGSYLETALRETREELGEKICPTRILGVLPSVTTHSTGYIIHPIVGLLEEPLELEPDSWEVAEVLSLPLKVFLTPSITEPVEFDSDNINIWGATARIAHQFINCLREGEEF
jgi:8-oxo-dGTP pyrophosphatase MutT (NUDIX family)